MKSASEASVSPIGASSETVSRASLSSSMTLRREVELVADLRRGRVAAEVLEQVALGAGDAVDVSTMCTGMRIVRAWSAIARDTAWRIHQVA